MDKRPSPATPQPTKDANPPQEPRPMHIDAAIDLAIDRREKTLRDLEKH